MVIVYCVLAIVGLYIVFIFAPALVMYRFIFRRQPTEPLLERDLDGMGLAAYGPALRDAFRYFEELPFTEVTAAAADGTVLAGRYYPRGNGKIVICMHGYRASPLNSFAVMARFLSEQGYDLLLPWERGHGDSGGRYTSLGVLEQQDVLAWSAWACGRDEIDQVVLAGVSMGCTAICYASDRLAGPKLKAMILDCGFISPEGQIAVICKKRSLPAPLLVPIIRFAARLGMGADISAPAWKSLERARLPALFLHGERDEMVPLSCTETNYARCASGKRLCVVDGAIHTFAFLMGGAEAERAVTEFLDTHLEKGERQGNAQI